MRLGVVLLLLASTAPAKPAADGVDTIFVNAIVYTVDSRDSKAEAIAVREGRVAYVGSSAGARKLAGVNTRVVDLHGATVVPGLTDSHCHLFGIGEREMALNLAGTPSLAALLETVKTRVLAARPGEWIVGRGWIETFWSPATFPTRWDLDRVAPRNPLALERADGHAMVVNSAALAVAGITSATAAPFGGEIMHDPATGEPNGMLLDNAQELVLRHFPEPTEAERERMALLGAQRSLSVGWCSVQNAGGSWQDVELLRRLYGQGKLRLRIYQAISGPGADADRLIKQGASVGEFGGRFTVRTIKVGLDGALGSKGAALLEPYVDHPTSGFLKYKETELLPMLRAALVSGVQVETHAIGDRANRVILDLYERAFADVMVSRCAVAEPRWRVEHAQIVHPDDVPRFRRLGVIPSMQPSHAIGDLHFAPSRIGIERMARGYSWRSILDTGSIICGGSDAPVEVGDPMIEFYAAVARRDLKGFQGEGWHPEQAVDRRTALRMFTIWPAIAAFEETWRGSIEVGKVADFTVLTADIMMIPPAEIPKTRCLMTVIGGEVVYEPTVRARHGTADAEDAEGAE